MEEKTPIRTQAVVRGHARVYQEPMDRLTRTNPTSVTATRAIGGVLADGREVAAIVLRNGRGISARILALGATLQSLCAPDRNGHSIDITRGPPDVASMEAARGFLGVTVGRYANRIAGGRFVLDGQAYQLACNDGPNSLHGGPHGFDQCLWTLDAVTSGEEASVTLGHISPDGDNGYPGALHARVTYTLDHAGDLTIAFTATTSAPTIVNMTNHALFNLGGGDGIYAHLMIPASHHTPTGPARIPTGALEALAGTMLDFRAGADVTANLDHNFALDKGPTTRPELAARLVHAASGRVLDVLSTEPGLQVYTDHALGGIALEPQKFPDAPNQPAFLSARLDHGETYRHTMIYRMRVAE